MFGAGQPHSSAAPGAIVWVVLAATGRVVKLSATGGPDDFVLPVGCTNPSRIASAPNGTVALLSNTTLANSAIWILNSDGKLLDHFTEAFATDVAWESNAVLVIARQSGADFHRDDGL